MTILPARKLGVRNSSCDPGMHEMRRSEAVQHHSHRHVDGRREVYAAHKLNDKEHSKGGSSQANKSDHRSKQHGVTSQIPGAMRICGDWSEHLSSNGKVYFFNNKTKSSQWERPKEWSSSRTVEVKKDKSKSSNLHNKVVPKHSTEGSGGGGQQHLSRQHKAHPATDAKKVQTQHHSRHAEGSKDFRDRDYRNLSSNSSAKDRDYRDIDYRDANSSRSTDSRLSNDVDSHSQHRVDRDYRSAGPGHHDGRQASRRAGGQGGNTRVSSQAYNGKSSSSLGNDTQYSSKHSETNDSNLTDGARAHHRDDGHSNNSTPRSATEATKRDWHGAKKGSADFTENNDSSTANGGEGTPTTSALVQTLSSVLQASTTTKNKEDTSIEGNLKNALQMLLDVAARNQNASTESAVDKVSEETVTKQPVAEQKPTVEVPVKRQRTYTTAIDEHVRNAMQVSANAEQLLNSIRVVADDGLVLHVQGWPTDQLERQSNRLSDENHQFVVNHTSELCASMKVARSQVRSAEIHSTLQEQRVLYLRQQIKDLEKSATIAPFT